MYVNAHSNQIEQPRPYFAPHLEKTISTNVSLPTTCGCIINYSICQRSDEDQNRRCSEFVQMNQYHTVKLRC